MISDTTLMSKRLNELFQSVLHIKMDIIQFVTFW